MPEQLHIDVARAALLEETPEATIGALVDESREEDGSITLRFESKLPGYPGWLWTVSLAHLEGFDPTVLEAELLPGDSALLAPDWVPWADRLAEYKAAQEAAEAEAAAAAVDAAESDESDDEDADSDESEDFDDDEDDSDEDDIDEDILGSDVLHGGDLDGVDIDDLDASALDEDADDELDESDDDSDDAADDEGERSY